MSCAVCSTHLLSQSAIFGSSYMYTHPWVEVYNFNAPQQCSLLLQRLLKSNVISPAKEACRCQNTRRKLCTVCCLAALSGMSHIVYIEVHHSFLKGACERAAATAVMSMALPL